MKIGIIAAEHYRRGQYSMEMYRHAEIVLVQAPDLSVVCVKNRHGLTEDVKVYNDPHSSGIARPFTVKPTPLLGAT